MSSVCSYCRPRKPPSNAAVPQDAKKQADAPLIARSPKTLVAAPRDSSTRSNSSGEMRVQYTQPPKGSLTGIPSQSTSDRLAPLDPRPRSDTPCVVDWPLRSMCAGTSVKPGMERSRSSMFTPGCSRTSVSSSTVMNAGASVSTFSTTVIVLLIGSGTWRCWSRVSFAPRSVRSDHASAQSNRPQPVHSDVY